MSDEELGGTNPDEQSKHTEQTPIPFPPYLIGRSNEMKRHMIVELDLPEDADWDRVKTALAQRVLDDPIGELRIDDVARERERRALLEKIAGESIVDQLTGANFRRGQVGLTVGAATLRLRAGRIDDALQDIEDVLIFTDNLDDSQAIVDELTEILDIYYAEPSEE